jgi:acyl-CoA reductase-like NAD-dependent aldehyde dehydrogenase
MTLTELRELADAVIAQGFGRWRAPQDLGTSEDYAFVDACSPEVIRALVAVAEAAETLDSRTMKARIAALRRLEDALDALKAALA